MTLHGTIDELAWESEFFGLRSAIVRLQEDAPALDASAFDGWPRLQAKISASNTQQLDALQHFGFRLVEGEADFALSVPLQAVNPQAQTAVAGDIAPLRQMAENMFSQSRFRAPWYPEEASGRFYAQWIENAVKGVFDHECLLFRGANGDIEAFVSLRQLNEQEAGSVYWAGVARGKTDAGGVIGRNSGNLRQSVWRRRWATLRLSDATLAAVR
jgi:dTDP-4-amino-4,6-dideoxy-D-galactose acyltransferase